MTCQILCFEKNENCIMKLLSAEFAQRSVTVKEDPNQTVCLGMDCSINYWGQDQSDLLSVERTVGTITLSV